MMVMVYEAILARLQHFRVSYGSVLLKNLLRFSDKSDFKLSEICGSSILAVLSGLVFSHRGKAGPRKKVLGDETKTVANKTNCQFGNKKMELLSNFN